MLRPEAHRSRNGKLGRFYSGAFKVAVETGVPVVPLCITGTDEMLPPGRWWLRPARVCLIRRSLSLCLDPTPISIPLPWFLADAQIGKTQFVHPNAH